MYEIGKLLSILESQIGKATTGGSSSPWMPTCIPFSPNFIPHGCLLLETYGAKNSVFAKPSMRAGDSALRMACAVRIVPKAVSTNR